MKKTCFQGSLPAKTHTNLHNYYMSCVVCKPVFRVSDQVRHKPGCTATGNGYMLEISDLESRESEISV